MIRLPGDEASDAINFVLKDDATNTWWAARGRARTPGTGRRPACCRPSACQPAALCDGMGDAMHRRGSSTAGLKRVLRRSLASACTLARMHPPPCSRLGPRYDHRSTNFAVPLRPERDDIEDIPRELCDTWAWIKWDYGGRPQRSTVGAGGTRAAVPCPGSGARGRRRVPQPPAAATSGNGDQPLDAGPRPLCNSAGPPSPPNPQAQANEEYDAAVEEMEMLLRGGRCTPGTHA